METPPPPYAGPGEPPADVTAMLAAPPALACTRCTAPLPDEYHMADDRVICGRCRATLQAQATKPAQGGGFARAAGMGLSAAVACAAVYALILIFSTSVLGVLIVGIGWLVGMAVKRGAGAHASRRYQFLAVALTWFSLGGAYAGAMLHEMVTGEGLEAEVAADEAPAPPPVAVGETAAPEPGAADAPAGTLPEEEALAEADVAAATEADGAITAAGVGAAAVMGIAGLALMAVAAPVIVAVGSPLSALITAFGLFQAWKQAEADPPVVVPALSGPFRAAGAYVPPPPPPLPG
jgi:hypothetical protein